MKEEDTKLLIVAAAAGALGIAGLLRWRQLSKLKQTPAAGSLRVGIIGTGWGVKVQLPQFRRAGLDVTAIASRSQETAVTLAAQHHIANPYSDVIALCQSPDVDLVSVVTPPYLHAEQMIAALVGGKHVLVDKPMARDSAEGERMLAAASAHSKQVAIVDHELRFTPAFQRARELLHEGAIGAVRAVETCALLPGLGPDWTWWSDTVSGGGVLGAIGSHIIDAYRFLLDAEFDGVSARLATIIKERTDRVTGKQRACTADDYASVDFTLAPRRGAEHSPVWESADAVIKGHFTAGLVGSPPPGASSVTITGSRGAITIDVASSSMRAFVDRKEIAAVKGKGNAFAVTGTHALGVALQRALGPEKDAAALQSAATVADGLAVMYVMDAARASSEAGGAWKTPQVVQQD